MCIQTKTKIIFHIFSSMFRFIQNFFHTFDIIIRQAYNYVSSEVGDREGG